MNDGSGVLQSPINKQLPASGQDAPCTNGSIIGLNNVTVVFNETNWQIQIIGAQAPYFGPLSISSTTNYYQTSIQSSTVPIFHHSFFIRFILFIFIVLQQII